ncbi:MAG: hypothetical protein CMJ50_03860 [Planctomycetaceae bacterium]|nr:hypothetical protein [Planctomycetaceae bacterium]
MDWIDAYRERRGSVSFQRVVEVVEESPEPPPSPHSIQQEALAALKATREAGNEAGLVVLATGLGKTWLAAFDSASEDFRRVLFVAHREEILAQAMQTFRRIRPQARLGLYTGKEKSPDADVLFASIQTLGRMHHLSQFAREQFEYIIVDEFHHAAARTYRRLIEHFTPRFLLGLTATPERMDGGDLLALCQENLVYRKDLVAGIEAGLLCPFRYFGVPDEVDYSNIPWRSSRFDEEELTNAVATTRRAENALEQFRQRGGDRTLGFCCSQRHADFMADYPKLLATLILRDAQFRTILKIHAAFEWALFYACVQRPYDSVISHLRLTDQSEHSDLLAAAARKIGLTPPQHGFRPVWGGKLDDFLAGKAELGTVLSIAILMAANDGSHPLRRVAAKNQDFVIQLFDMKRKRDAQGHGEGKVNKGEIELPDESFMRETVSTLLPSVVFSSTCSVEVDKDAVADLLLDARTSIQNEFGFGLFNRLGTNLQGRLIHAERFWLTCNDGDDALAFACDLYAAVQGAFRQKLSGVLRPDVGDSELPILAKENASQAGLGHLPERLCNVNPVAIQKTLQGDDQTLGACVVAFLVVSNAEDLLSVADM